MPETPEAAAPEPKSRWYNDPNSGHIVLARAGGSAAKRGAGVAAGGGMLAARQYGNPASGSSFYDDSGTNHSYHVLFALTASFLIVFGTHMAAANLGNTAETTGRVSNALNGRSTRVSLVSWLVIAIVLLSASSFKTTGSLAVAFSWLIFVAVVLINGTQILQMVNSFTGNTSAGISKTPPTPKSNTNPVKL